MNRRYFFQQLASGLVAAVAPALFLPKLIKPAWKTPVKFVGVDWGSPQGDITVMTVNYVLTEQMYLAWLIKGGPLGSASLNGKQLQVKRYTFLPEDSEVEIRWGAKNC